ncbi:hypothetical protein NDU88_004922, partial [Pleurodeles waltl]
LHTYFAERWNFVTYVKGGGSCQNHPLGFKVYKGSSSCCMLFYPNATHLFCL